MIKKYLVVLISVLILVSCNKDEAQTENKGYYVKYKLNGTQVLSTGQNYAFVRPNETIAGKIDFGLSSQTNDFKHAFNLYIQKDASIATGTYDQNGSYYMHADYFENAGMVTEKTFTSETGPGMPPYTLTIVITSITPASISGSFTGNYLYDQVNNSSIQITEGEFFVKRMK
jgi:hypothetical protein